MTSSNDIRLIACSILKKEIEFLMNKNHWQFHTAFLSSGLHVNYHRLQHRLEKVLDSSNTPAIVVFGACHPLMDKILSPYRGQRVAVQNCIELLLGKDAFTAHLERGAFFLLEEWAHSWNKIMGEAIGDLRFGQQEILHDSHSHLLCIKTPCSHDFSKQATQIAGQIKLPVRWHDVSLDHMEHRLRECVLSVEAM